MLPKNWELEDEKSQMPWFPVVNISPPLRDKEHPGQGTVWYTDTHQMVHVRRSYDDALVWWTSKGLGGFQKTSIRYVTKGLGSTDKHKASEGIQATWDCLLVMEKN